MSYLFIEFQTRVSVYIFDYPLVFILGQPIKMFYFKITFDLFFSMNLHILNTLTRYCLVVKKK